jgi:uncharacterized protein YxjI
MKFRIKQKFFSLTDSFNIEDEHGNLAFTAKGKLLSISSGQTLYDAQEQEVLKIKRKYLSLRPACRLVMPDGKEWLIKQRFWPFWKTRFTIDTPTEQFEITGNFLQYEYEVKRGDTVLASISKAFFSLSDTYGVDVFDASMTEQILATVIVIDRLQHDESGSFTAGD